jgi:uncharacterized OB-fold protein
MARDSSPMTPRAVSRPRPTPTPLTAPFWEHACRRVLVRPRCDVCGRSFFTPQVACPACLSEAWTWTPSSGVGRVCSHSTCHRAPAPGFDLPYVLGVVDLEEDWSMLTNIVECDPADVEIGMTVTVTWLDIGDGLMLPVFRPEG